MNPDKRQKTTIALTPKADDLLAEIAKFHGISRTSVIEMLVRAEARNLGLE
jgi:predicted DNA-binding protein YlxM (UPF0122 family)